MTKEMGPFVQAFSDAKGKRGDRVGIKTLSEIIKNCGIQKTPKQLVAEGWIVPLRASGDKETGAYGLGVRMVEILESTPPKDPIDHARWLLAKKPELLARFAELQAARDTELAEINERYRVLLEPIDSKLVDIGAVEAVYGQLETMFVKRPSS